MGLNELEEKLNVCSKKIDLLVAKIDGLLGTAPLADEIDESECKAEDTSYLDLYNNIVDDINMVIATPPKQTFTDSEPLSWPVEEIRG